jgi:uncharacterized protein HemX
MLAIATGGIVVLAIVVAAVLVALIALMPRISRAREERRLQARRQEVAGRHRDEATVREERAELAEREARRARAEAEIHEQEARLHEQGLADDRLREPHGRFSRETEPETAVERERGGVR